MLPPMCAQPAGVEQGYEGCSTLPRLAVGGKASKASSGHSLVTEEKASAAVAENTGGGAAAAGKNGSMLGVAVGTECQLQHSALQKYV
jgi:hypothetical protein